MAVAQRFLAELDYELPATRRVIERFPTDKGGWKPHPRSSAFGNLVQLVARLPGVMRDIVKGKNLDLAASKYTLEKTETLLREFDENARTLTDALRSAKDEVWALDWSLVMGDQVLQTSRRDDVMRNTINHLVHHRGQLTVYLRLNEIAVPQLYGPTADEK
jgi:uncharacterized damage-inducible protein DinB